jgi:hypothetical protein
MPSSNERPARPQRMRPFCDEIRILLTPTRLETVATRRAGPLGHRLAGWCPHSDFYLELNYNVGLLSAAAASMLLLARQLRGFTSVTDAVLPLAILNFAQAESLMIAFPMNLVLTTVFSVAVIKTTLLADRRPARSTTLRFGMLIVVLPLCGGSGLVMLPPLVLWMISYVSFAWWSRREHGGASRAIGVGLLMICAGGPKLAGPTCRRKCPPTSFPTPKAPTIALRCSRRRVSGRSSRSTTDVWHQSPLQT